MTLLKNARLATKLATARLVGLVGLSGLASVLLGAWFGQSQWQPAKPMTLSAVDIRPQWTSAWITDVIASDPAAQQIVASYVSGLSAAGYESSRQGVWVSAGQYPVAEHAGEVPIPAASLTKIATTLAALARWGPAYRFETLVGWQGQFDADSGVINGDLVIEGGDDPLFVWEEAIALGNALEQMGIRRVTGNLIIAGRFTMNFETSPEKSGTLLKQALNGSAWDNAVQVAHQNLPAGTPVPQISIGGSVKAETGSRKNRVDGWLMRHDSLSLVAVLKAMNIYSNNPMAEQMADTVGGPTAVIAEVESVTDITAAELRLVNGSGLGEDNQLSPRAAVLMLQGIQDILRSNNLTLADIFPVAGADGGTIVDRGLPSNAVVKTGSLAVVSALAGVLPTEERGLVWFSLINYGSGLDALRSRQDQVIAALEQQWGQAASIPPELKTTVVIGQSPYQFGNPDRNFSMLTP